jgi:hypothetical protein
VRRRRLPWIALASVVFLAVSFELALVLTAGARERTKVVDLLKAQARGDAGAMARQVAECRGGCPALAGRMQRPGTVKILKLDSASAWSFGTTEGTTRVAWATLRPKGSTVVQCVRVRRKWSFLSGASIRLQRLSAPIGLEAGC